MSADTLATWRIAEACYVLGRGERSQLATAAATVLLSRPQRSPILSQLASPTEAEDPRDTRDLVAFATQELGLEPLDPHQATWLLIQETATAISTGRASPEVGAREIWSLAELLPERDRPTEFAAIVSDWDEMSSEREAIRADIIVAARRLLSR